MEAKPTYHLPPNFSTPPPPQGPFHLGTVLEDFEKKEQMRPLNQGPAQRIDIAERHEDNKTGFRATRKRLKNGEFGLWAKFAGFEGIGGELNLSMDPSDSDTYKVDSIKTEYFYPSRQYVSACLALPDVDDYLKGSRYKKPVYIITGIKVGHGVEVKLERQATIKGALEVGLNSPIGANIKIGPQVQATLAHERVDDFAKSSDIVIGIQCIKIYHQRSLMFGQTKVKTEYVTSGATFYGEKKESTEQPTEFLWVGPEDYEKLGWVTCTEGDEIWVSPNEPEAS
ncbi:hypothetical protein GGR51DRAFT_537425 [Nemania sp. FL0031]|nr:hypothetical protein GGR51DRAFT_537425 [Nemania sp. FL0031]